MTAIVVPKSAPKFGNVLARFFASPPRVSSPPLAGSDLCENPVSHAAVVAFPAPSVPLGARPLPAAVYFRRRAGVFLGAMALIGVAALLAWISVEVVTIYGVVEARSATVASPESGLPGVPLVSTPAPVQHVVQPGETLWSIAEALEPKGDIRVLVDELADRAGGTVSLEAGQRVDVTGLGVTRSRG